MAATHSEEGHQIFDRVTRLETQMSTLVGQVTTLAEAQHATNAALSEIKSMLAGAGKMDAKTIITMAGSVFGGFLAMGYFFIAPIERDYRWVQATVVETKAALGTHGHPELSDRMTRLEGETKLLSYKVDHATFAQPSN